MLMLLLLDQLCSRFACLLWQMQRCQQVKIVPTHLSVGTPSKGSGRCGGGANWCRVRAGQLDSPFPLLALSRSGDTGCGLRDLSTAYLPLQKCDDTFCTEGRNGQV